MHTTCSTISSSCYLATLKQKSNKGTGNYVKGAWPSYGSKNLSKLMFMWTKYGTS